jgi:hypothetical protein
VSRDLLLGIAIGVAGGFALAVVVFWPVLWRAALGVLTPDGGA